MRFSFEIEARDGLARRGTIQTAHGEIRTPAFMPVGTAATVKGMTPESVRETGADIILANTYHLMLRPGEDRVEKFGGLHRFMHWERPILTDSGGFQVMSLSKLRKMSEEGVQFQSHLDGSRHMLTPERAMEIQRKLDSTISMVLDECTPFPVSEKEAAESMRLSMRWALRSKEAFAEREGYAVFGINQGSTFADLREESANALREIGFDGYAIGGLAVGEGQELMFSVLDDTVQHLPEEAPRYLMGVGKPDDLIGAVMRGVDMFDCVIPTRSGRNAKAFVDTGELNLRNSRFADDPSPLMEGCACPLCSHYSRGYLHHLLKAGEMLGPMLLTWHNLHFYQVLMADMRAAISEGRLAAFAQSFLSRYNNPDTMEAGNVA